MKKIGIIGAGAMGSGIAQVAATAGCEVLLYDTSEEAINKSRDKLIKIMNRLVEKGRITDEESRAIQGRHYYINEFNSFAECELIIEAIVEHLDVKQGVFKELESIVSEDTVLATNTSSLPVTSIASVCAHPERVIGIHFFNPAPLMALVEVVPALQTAADLPRDMVKLMEAWGKIPVVAKDLPGFIVNRIARPFYSEALRIYDEGLATPEQIDHVMKYRGGFRMGPFELMDFIGHDVNFSVTRSMYEAYFHEPRYRPSFSQQRLVDAGYLGRKTGKGFYEYPREGVDDVEVSDDLTKYIFHRIISMLVNEAADALYYQVATREEIDTAMTKGVNYPKGLLKWGDELGKYYVIDILDDLFDTYRESRYRVSPMLRKLDKTGGRFYN